MLESAQLSNKFGYRLHTISLLFWHFINTPAYLWADSTHHLPLAVVVPTETAQPPLINCNDLISSYLPCRNIETFGKVKCTILVFSTIINVGELDYALEPKK